MRPLIAFSVKVVVRRMRIWPPAAGRRDVDFELIFKRLGGGNFLKCENTIPYDNAFIFQNALKHLRFLRVEVQSFSVNAIIDRLY